MLWQKSVDAIRIPVPVLWFRSMDKLHCNLWVVSLRQSVMCCIVWRLVAKPTNVHPRTDKLACFLGTVRLSAKLVPTFADWRCHMVRATDPQGRILGFLNRSRYFLFQAAPQLYSRGWVDPVPDPLFLRKSGSAGNRIRTFGSAASNPDH
jgi:hypothetical protein